MWNFSALLSFLLFIIGFAFVCIWPNEMRVIMVGDGVPAPLCGVLPMVALTPKGVRYPGLSANSPSVMPLQILRYAQG